MYFVKKNVNINLNFSKAERDEFVMEMCQIPCFPLPLPQSHLNDSVGATWKPEHPQKESLVPGEIPGPPRQAALWSWRLPEESNLYKQHGNAALGEAYSHDEPPKASTCYQPGAAQAPGH